MQTMEQAMKECTHILKEKMSNMNYSPEQKTQVFLKKNCMLAVVIIVVVTVPISTKLGT